MELKKLSEHIWYMPFEEERDRPNLGYIMGSNRSLAIDAGHSEAHIAEFYDLIRKEGLPLPSLTVLTHWHWDHTFAMHAVNGLTLANKRTNEHLLECRNKIEENGPEGIYRLDHAVTKTQKTILKAFDMDPAYIKHRANRISEQLKIADNIGR